MPFSQQKLDRLKSGIAQKLESSSINEWERNFLLSMQAKLDRYGQSTKLSDKQYSTLMRLVSTSSRRVNVIPISAGPKRRQARPAPRPTRRNRFYRPRLKKKLKGFLMLVLAGFALVGLLTNERQSSSWPDSKNGVSEIYQKLVSARNIRVIDGDTVKISGESRSIRLVGFNTPETMSAQCSRERELGNQASRRLNEMLSSASEIEFQRVRCACQPGTEGTQACNFGRLCGRLFVDGKDVGSKLISERLAVRYICGATGCPPRPGNWCG
ncbi:thermonuclease family protein [Ruegeria atlantica]|uniref:thermonuclease family protein n=1 Tax=Ruegeria atlantica TaxID=81569 RepID=UPI002495A289|nr:thermonuclease family protein [Ruegeria atlantica]